jgi:predicted acylesterase/phospholipase RssA
MGALAQAGLHDLLRNVLRASAALPGLFAPVELRLPASDKTVCEVLIDGGVEMQFLAVPSYAFTSRTDGFRVGQLLLLVNNTLAPALQMAPGSALRIAQSALTAVRRANSRALVDATRLYARKTGTVLMAAAIDPDAGIVWNPDERFSSDYVNALFDHGYARGVQGALWGTGAA